jgi:hypothetical protein
MRLSANSTLFVAIVPVMLVIPAGVITVVVTLTRLCDNAASARQRQRIKNAEQNGS